MSPLNARSPPSSGTEATIKPTSVASDARAMRRVAYVLSTALACSPAPRDSAEPATAPSPTSSSETAKKKPAAWSSADTVKGQCDEVLTMAQAELEALGTAATDDPDAWADRLDRLVWELSTLRFHAIAVKSSHPEETVRQASAHCLARASEMSNAVLADPRVVDRAARVVDRVHPSKVAAMREIGARQQAAPTDPAHRQALFEHGRKVEEALHVYQRNCSRDAKLVRVHAHEVDGLPPAFVEAHRDPETGEIWLGPGRHVTTTVLQHAANRDLRRRTSTAKSNLGYPDNVEPLHTILRGRFEMARLYESPNWSQFALKSTVLGSSAQLDGFFQKMAAAIAPLIHEEYREILLAKQRDEPGATQVEPWDEAYYVRKIRTQRAGDATRALQSLANFDDVKHNALAFFARVYGLDIRKVPIDEWFHPDVEMYEVRDEGTLVARLRIDPFPRPGKFKLAAMTLVRPAHPDPKIFDGALLLNLPDPRQLGPAAALSLDNLRLFLHELGHFFEGLLSSHGLPAIPRLAASMEDAELPAVFHSFWLDDYRAFSQIVRDPETGRTLDPAQFAALLSADRFGRAIALTQNLTMAEFAFRAHQADPEGLDLESLYRDMWNKHSPYPHPPDHRGIYGDFLMPTYNAKLIVYNWSAVASAQLWTNIWSKARSAREAGTIVREQIFGTLWTTSTAQWLRERLGGEPDPQVFVETMQRVSVPAP